MAFVIPFIVGGAIAGATGVTASTLAIIGEVKGFFGRIWSKCVFISFDCKIFENRSFDEVIYKIFDGDTDDDLIIEATEYTTNKKTMYHKLLIIKTESKFYYSIELYTSGIYIQRSKVLQDVLDWKGNNRKVSKGNTEIEKISLRMLLDILYNRKVNETYHVFTNNCRKFVYDLFNEFSTMQWNKYVFVSFDCKEFKNYAFEKILSKLFKKNEYDDLIIESTEYTSNKPTVLHKLLVIKTQNDYYYSIEKMNTGIYIQRSKNLDEVLKYEGKERKCEKRNPETIKESLRELITIIYNENQEIKSDNNVTRSNCRNFVVGIVKELLLVQWSKCIFISFNCKKFENVTLENVLKKSFKKVNLDEVLNQFYVYKYENNKKVLIIKTISDDYYSIENRAIGIYIQRSRNLDDVLKFEGNSREINKDKSEKINESLRNILNKIYNEITESYSDATSNCIKHVDFIIKELRETLQ